MNGCWSDHPLEEARDFIMRHGSFFEARGFGEVRAGQAVIYRVVVEPVEAGRATREEKVTFRREGNWRLESVEEIYDLGLADASRRILREAHPDAIVFAGGGKYMLERAAAELEDERTGRGRRVRRHMVRAEHAKRLLVECAKPRVQKGVVWAQNKEASGLSLVEAAADRLGSWGLVRRENAQGRPRWELVLQIEDRQAQLLARFDKKKTARAMMGVLAKYARDFQDRGPADDAEVSQVVLAFQWLGMGWNLAWPLQSGRAEYGPHAAWPENILGPDPGLYVV